jgi:hypothetical protein
MALALNERGTGEDMALQWVPLPGQRAGRGRLDGSKWLRRMRLASACYR